MWKGVLLPITLQVEAGQTSANQLAWSPHYDDYARFWRRNWVMWTGSSYPVVKKTFWGGFRKSEISLKISNGRRQTINRSIKYTWKKKLVFPSSSSHFSIPKVKLPIQVPTGVLTSTPREFYQGCTMSVFSPGITPWVAVHSLPKRDLQLQAWHVLAMGWPSPYLSLQPPSLSLLASHFIYILVIPKQFLSPGM